MTQQSYLFDLFAPHVNDAHQEIMLASRNLDNNIADYRIYCFISHSDDFLNEIRFSWVCNDDLIFLRNIDGNTAISRRHFDYFLIHADPVVIDPLIGGSIDFGKLPYEIHNPRLMPPTEQVIAHLLNSAAYLRQKSSIAFNAGKWRKSIWSLLQSVRYNLLARHYRQEPKITTFNELSQYPIPKALDEIRSAYFRYDPPTDAEFSELLTISAAYGATIS